MPKRAWEPTVGEPVAAQAPSVINNITNHITNNNNLNNYFAPQQGPTSSTTPTESAESAHLFAGDRKRIKVIPYHKKTRQVYTSYVDRDGQLMGGCEQCVRNGFVPMARFASIDSNKTHVNLTEFKEALGAFDVAVRAGDKEEATRQRKVVEETRNGFCDSCQKTRNKLTRKQQACNAWWDTKRKEMAKAQDGCVHPECLERGEEAWCVLEADHGTNPKKKKWDKKNKKWVPVALSEYTWWATNGGVEAMKEELTQIEQWICRHCHRLETTGTAGNRCNPNDMLEGKWNGTKEEIAQYEALRVAKITHPKMQYVDGLKQKIGHCVDCHRPVVVGNEAGFDFNHMDPNTKAKGGLFGERGGVSGLVNNHANAAKLHAKVGDKTVKDLLDEEVAKCNLPCANCHHRHTCGYPKRAPLV